MNDQNGKIRSFDLGTIAADPKRLSDGVWFEIWREFDTSLDGKVVEAPTDGPCVLVVPFGIAYERALDEARKPYYERLRAGTATDQDLRQINGQALARATFRGCHNLQVNGEPVIWSEAKAVELMTDERWIRLREFVMRKAQDKAASAAREEAQATGN